jgi:hypothetical protein
MKNDEQSPHLTGPGLPLERFTQSFIGVLMGEVDSSAVALTKR